MSRPRVLLMDEPTRGVDVAAKFEILESMRRLAAEGLGIVFATSDLAEVQAVATTGARDGARAHRRRAAADRRDGRRARRGGVSGAGERQRRSPMTRLVAAPRGSLLSLVLRLRALIALVVLSIAFSLLSPEFLTTGNLAILSSTWRSTPSSPSA